MTQYFCVEPEVAGGLERDTVMDRSVHPPIVSKLHYECDGWLGDALLASFPSFIVTEEAKRRFQEIGVSGARFDEVKATTSGEFRDFYPNRRLPNFVWLRVDGDPGQDDFGTTLGGKLVLSERVLEALKELGIPNALITPFGG